MNSSTRRMQVLVLMLAVALGSAGAQATTITLDVSPATPTSGEWAPLDLVEVIVRAASDGDATHGVGGAEFRAGDWAISVLDPTKLKIHDVLADVQQVDTEDAADAFDPVYPEYAKAEDTWICHDFTYLVGPVVMGDATFEAAPSALMESGQALGTGGIPADFLHIVLEIQPGFEVGETACVEFYGQLMAYNTPENETTSIVFGCPGGAVGRGSFEIEVTPEPSAMLFFLAGAGVLWRRRRRPAS